MSPKVLDQVLARLPQTDNPNVLVGFNTADDAGVYQLTPDLALVQTTDFFTPIVDDPYTFGQIAAANSLSDIYAMGGVPLTALSILCFPNKGDIETLSAILRGGGDKMREAGCAILGGHSVSDDEIKFGYAVTGTVHPQRIWTNAGARPGDVLLLSKPLGTGVIATAGKRGIASEEDLESAIDSMVRLNRSSAEMLSAHAANAVHGCTDITGFGLLGHAREMAVASNVTLEIEAAAVPLLPGALDYARHGAIPGGLRNNRDFASCAVELARPLPPELESLLYDPQTSGGLLASVASESAERLLAETGAFTRVGRVTARQATPLVVR